MNDRIKILLILKYGSISQAFTQWLAYNKPNRFTKEEKKFMVDYLCKTYPELTQRGLTNRKD